MSNSMAPVTITIAPSGDGKSFIATVKHEDGPDGKYAGPDGMYAHETITDLLLLVADQGFLGSASNEKARKLRKISEVI